MKTFCCIVASAVLLISVPAMAQQLYGDGHGVTNIWSSSQGTSDSYGDAKGFSTSSSGSVGQAGGRGGLSIGGGGLTASVTTSHSVVSSTGSGYAQTQTSGYAGGTVSGLAGRGH
jgi:hypothetical protein